MAWFEIPHSRKSSSPSAEMTDRRASAGGLLLPQLLDLGLLAPQLAQVVELGATHVTAGHDLDPVERRAVDRVRPLDTDAEADLPDLEGLAQPAALAADHDALEDLDAGAVTLDDPGVHLDGVTGAEGGNVGALRLGVESVQRVHRCILLLKAHREFDARMGDSDPARRA